MPRSVRLVVALVFCALPSSGLSAPAGPKPLSEFPDALAAKLTIPVNTGLGWYKAALSADGKTVVCAAAVPEKGPAILDFDVTTGRLVREMPFSKDQADGVKTMALSADGKVVAAALSVHVAGGATSKPLVKVWDLAGGRERASLSDVGYDYPRLCLSPDGRWLAGGAAYTSPRVAGGWTGEVRVWDLSTGKAVVSVDATAGMFKDACLSPDGKTFVWIAGWEMHLGDTATGKETAIVPLPKQGQDDVRISPDGRTMVTAGEHLAVFWDFPTRTPKKAVVIKPIGGGRPCFTSDSKLVAIPMYQQAVFFDAATGEPTGAVTAARPKYVPHSMSISGDGKLLATADWDRVRLFDASKLEPPPVLPPAPDAQALAMSDIPATESGTPKTPHARKPKSGATADPPAASPAVPATRPAAPAVATALPPPPPAPATPATRPAGPPAVAGTPAAVPPAGSPDKVPAPPADAIAGVWTAKEEGLQEVWTVGHTGQAWTVSVVYKRKGTEAGAAHGTDVAFADGTLTFTRVFDKKPSHIFSDHTKCTMQLKDGRIDYLSTAGTKSKRLTLDRESGR